MTRVASPPSDEAAGSDTGPVALIAGAGDLPLVVAEELSRQGREVLVIAVDGESDRDYSMFRHETVTIGAVGRLREILAAGGCRYVMMLGAFRRPHFSEIEWNLGTVRALSRIMMLRFGGDDAAVNGVVSLFESEGFRVVGPRDMVPGLIAGDGLLTRCRPDRQAREDIAHGFRAIAQMGGLDIGQAVVVLNRRIVAVEAAEGTTAMIERIAGLRGSRRVATPAPSGVVVKGLKPRQESRLDMPVIGPETIRAVAASGLSGIAVEAGGVIVVRRDEVIRCAQEHDVFVVGMRPPVRAEAGS